MGPRWGAFAVLAAGLVGLGAWWSCSDDATSAGPAAGAAVPSLSPTLFVRSAEGDALAVDAGVGRVTGRVTREDGAPVAGAEVLLFDAPPPTEGLECGVCHLHVLECPDAKTVQQVLAGLRAGHLRRAAPTARTVTDASGAFVFEAAPLGREVQARAAGGSAEGTSQLEPMALVLSGPPITQTLTITDFGDGPVRSAPEPVVSERGSVTVSVTSPDERPVPGARVTVFSERTGALAEYASDARGHVTLTTVPDDAWYAVEAEGCLPAGGRQTDFVVGPPMALTVRTTLGGQPVDAALEGELHFATDGLRTRGGVLRLEGLPPGLVVLRAVTPALVSPEVGVELVGAENEVTLELLAGAKLFVTAVTEAGEPIALVDGNLSSEVHGVNVSATAEQGAPLVMGPVPEGEYRLAFSAEGFVSTERTIDLKPGENTLELTLRAASFVTGRVLDRSGAPVGNARVEVIDGEVDVTVGFSEDDGAFSMPVEQAGAYTLLAQHSLLGVAEVQVAVPGPPSTLVLQPRGVIEAELFEVDGTPLAPDVSVRTESSVIGTLEAVGETRVGRRAGLAPGSYRLEVSRTDRLPLVRTVELRGDEVVRVALRLEAGASLTGRVVKATGEPVPHANVFAAEHSAMTTSDEEGRFSYQGLRPGPVELYAFGDRGVTSDTVQATAPGRDVVLTIPTGKKVSGRVVDEAGAPVARVNVNETLTGADGRFVTEAHELGLELFADGFLTRTIEDPPADLGDVVLQRALVVEGEVVDHEGRPVSGASVRTEDNVNAAASDAAGRFKLTLTVDGQRELIASRGSLFGRAPLQARQRARIVLAPGTKVLGRVLKPGGGGQATSVTIHGPRFGGGAEQLDTDAEGRFEITLPEATWTFTTAVSRTARAVAVRGASMELTLGAGPSDCGLLLTAPEPVLTFKLLPAGVPEPGDDTPVPGAIDFPGRRLEATVTARALPCGDYVAEALLRSGLVRQPVSLREQAQPVRLDLSFRTVELDTPPLPLPE